MPQIPALLATVGLGALVSEELEWLLTGLAATLAIGAGVSGYRKHRSWRVAAPLFGLAVVLLVARTLEGVGLGHAAAPLAILAGLGLFVGHLLNLRACRACGSDDCAE